MCPGSGRGDARRLCHVDNSVAAKRHFDTDTPPRSRGTNETRLNVPPQRSNAPKKNL